MIKNQLYVRVLIGIFLGGLIGYLNPSLGTSLKPLGDGFIALIKMLIGPVIFFTVVLGIAGAGDLKNIGRVGAKALVYFELISSLALIIGLMVGNWLQPGSGFHVDPASLNGAETSEYIQRAQQQSGVSFVMHLIPKTFFEAFSGSGDLLQVLLVAILFGLAMNRLGEKGQPVHHFIEAASRIFLGMVGLVMFFAPVGAAGAMAFTVGKYGIGSLRPMLTLMVAFYLTCVLFIFFVLGTVSAWTGFNIFHFIVYIRGELLTVLGTSSSETVLVPLMDKLEKLGCPRSIVGLVVPAGYSFNLDGTNIYLTMAVLFIAQAFNLQLTLTEQLSILGVGMLTSKGASGVTGAGFVTLAATLAIVPKVPVAGMTLILGIDRFMSEARALTNVVGNGVAAIAISKWEGKLDLAKLKNELHRSS